MLVLIEIKQKALNKDYLSHLVVRQSPVGVQNQNRQTYFEKADEYLAENSEPQRHFSRTNCG